jgi:hypothetical protein
MAREDFVISHTYTIGGFGTNYIIFRNAENLKKLIFSKKFCERNCRIFRNIFIFENGIYSKLIIYSTNM